MKKSVKNLEFDIDALEDLLYWAQKDVRKIVKILELVLIIARDPFGGIGKPEPLQYLFSGCWSRRIDLQHRLVYLVEGERIKILSARLHYE